MLQGPKGPTAASGDWMKGPTPGTRLSFVRVSLQDKEWRKKSVMNTHTSSIQLSHTPRSLRSTVVWFDSPLRAVTKTLLWLRSFTSVRGPGASRGPCWAPQSLYGPVSVVWNTQVYIWELLCYYSRSKQKDSFMFCLQTLDLHRSFVKVCCLTETFSF